MAGKVILKKSSVEGKEPQVGDLEYGELALNYTDGILYYKNSSNAIVQAGSGGSNISLIQSGFVSSQKEGSDGAGIDAAYYDIDLTQSPYVPVDPDKSVAVFEGGFYSSTNTYYGAGSRFSDAVCRLMENGEKLRISSTDLTDSNFYFVGRWKVIEVV